MKFYSYNEFKLFEAVNLSNAPLIGIIAVRKIGTQYNRYFEQEKYFRKLVKIGQQNSLNVCVFSHNDLNEDFSKINRASFLINDKWVDMETKLPAVIYNRSKVTPLSFLTKLENAGVKLFTEVNVIKLANDKLKSQKFLVSKGIKMPIADIYSSNNLLKMLNYNESCILKPIFGSQGAGIIYIKYNAPGYTLKYEDKEISISDNELENKVNDIILKYYKLDPAKYLIQQYINLQKYNDSVFDIRVLMQKDGDNNIKRTGMGVRIGGANRITANLHTGGNKLELSVLLKELFNEDLDGPISNTIRNTSEKICKEIEKEIGSLGELALDYLIGETGNIYLIEINARPGRTLFEIMPEIHEKSIERPILYMKYLVKHL